MPKNKRESSESDSDSGPEDRLSPVPKKSKESNSKSKSKSGGAPTKWILEKQRHVTISEFRGRKLIDIREYYEKNGESLPGKKGISLSITQWKKLLEVADEINKAVAE
uniref:Transcriptional coactivator p15 (PC4) C-terminal domain-containing protein n=1 Tax=Glossina brevipalpis TaxID=37001 RepID=A0A1A9VZR5_9MUSC